MNGEKILGMTKIYETEPAESFPDMSSIPPFK